MKRQCPVCGSADSVAYCFHSEVEFVRCRGCDSIFQGRPPDWERLSKIYQGDYHLQRGHSGDAALEAVKAATTRAYLRLLERMKPPGKRLLEVGCSAGASLEAAAHAGWQVEGIELSPQSAEAARRRPGVQRVHTGTLLDFPTKGEGFDVVMLLDVIEHIDPPAPTLEAIHRVLSPGGLALFVTPDAGSWSARMMSARWPHLFVEHVIVYGRTALAGRLEAAGMSVERCGFAWKRVNLNMLVRHATIHRHVAFGGVLRVLGRIVPGAVQRMMVPFNIGEFYMVARRGG